VVFGQAKGFDTSLDLSSLDGTNGFQINGEAAGDGSDRSVSSAGDVNGNGFDDLIIGAARADPNGHFSGASYVVFGQPSEPIIWTGTEVGETFSGGPLDDRLDGAGGDDEIAGQAGDDRIRGGGGDDQLAGEDGNDLLKSGGGRDRLSGGESNDRLIGGPGRDV
jgi:Ca2+-binding RTX toxin-like protein